MMNKKSIAKTIFVGGLIAMSYCMGSAQESIKVGIARFEYLSGIAPQEARTLEDLCWSAFNGYYRYQVLDRTDMDAVYTALEAEKDEGKLLNNISQQGKAIGAEYLVLGQLNTVGPVSSTLEKYEDRKTGISYPVRRVSCPIRFTLRVLKTETGEILKSQVFEIGGISAYQTSNPEFYAPLSALKLRCKESAFYSAHRSMETFARNVFPGELRVKLLLKSTDKKAKRLWVTGNKPISWREYLEVYKLEHIDVDGELLEYEVSLGLATVKGNVDGLSIAECKVNTGKKEILQAIKSGEPVYLKSTGSINMVGIVKFMLLPLTPFIFRRPKL